MTANLGNSAVGTGLQKVSFHFNPKGSQSQRMFKIPHNCTQLTHQQSNAQNSPSQASTVHELGTSRCTSWIQKRPKTRNQIANICWIIAKAKNSRRISMSPSLTTLKPLTVWITTNWKILKKMLIPDHLTCFPRSLYADQEAIVRTGHGSTDWFKIGKGVRQGCVLSPCLFNLYAEYIV